MKGSSSSNALFFSLLSLFFLGLILSSSAEHRKLLQEDSQTGEGGEVVGVMRQPRMAPPSPTANSQRGDVPPEIPL